MARPATSAYGIDRWLLALSFAAGTGGTVALKLLDAPQWAPAAFAGGVILAYAALTFSLRTARLEPEQIGDNAYYLGFVLTLCSLAYTLWSLGTLDAETAFIAEVISGFGVALTSTIVGVAVRVFLMQFRVDLVAREREAQATLSDGLATFRSEIADVIRGTRYLGTEIRQTLADHHAEIAAADAARMTEATERLIRLMDEAMGAYAERAGAVQAGLARQSEAVVADTASRLETVADRADRAMQARTAEATARVDEATARALDAAEARLVRAIGRFETSANAAAARLRAASDTAGQATVEALHAHRAELRRMLAEDEADAARAAPPRAVEGGR